MQNGSVLVTLDKQRRIQSHLGKRLLSVVSNDWDAAVVYPNRFVGISDGDVERKIVRESVGVVSETELH